MSGSPPRVLALGNPDRGDDGAGPAVARRLRQLLGDRLDLRVLPGEATEILAAWEGARRVVVIDAVRSGAAAGTIHRIEVRPGTPEGVALPDDRSPSSHGFGLARAVALGGALDRLPPELVVYGIEAASVEPGAGLSPAVADAVERLAAEVALELTPESTAR